MSTKRFKIIYLPIIYKLYILLFIYLFIYLVSQYIL